MKHLVALAMIAFLVPATATVAFADNPCREDKAKFCKDAKAQKKSARDCLKEHAAELSPDCKTAMEKPLDPEQAKKKADKKAAKKAEKKDKKPEQKSGDKPADAKPAEEAAPAPAEPAAPGEAETKP